MKLPKLNDALERLGVNRALESHGANGEVLSVRSPIDGSLLATVHQHTTEQTTAAIARAHDTFLQWRLFPAPERGQLVRRFGELLREHKHDLAAIITWEVGKIPAESIGEVQEMIDICDFAVGLSRQLYGKTIATERPEHRMMEQWHPLGPVGIISAFNFPVAVWSWNAMLALTCGDSIIWKPSEKTPLSAIACQTLFEHAVASACGLAIPTTLSTLLIGAADIAQTIAADPRIPLISATGSVPMGRHVAQSVAARLGRSLLELGGNNGLIVTPSADLHLAARAIVFAAVGTCGQRCTSLRRLIVHESVADKFIARLKRVYESLPIGNPLDDGVLVGPLIDARAVEAMQSALATAKDQGAHLITGGNRVTSQRAGSSTTPVIPPNGHYVRPAIVEISPDAQIVQQETFAPILYVMRYQSLDEAIAIHNNVPQGLSSAIFTTDVRDAEKFLSPAGSDCGIANVNIGTSGAEIGGAFGGEKQTGGGREAGSDAWQNYMRRATNTINYSNQLPLAQGIKFDAN